MAESFWDTVFYEKEIGEKLRYLQGLGFRGRRRSQGRGGERINTVL